MKRFTVLAMKVAAAIATARVAAKGMEWFEHKMLDGVEPRGDK